MQIIQFNLESWCADVKYALFSNDISKIKSLRKAYNKPTILLQTWSDLEQSLTIKDAYFICEPRLQANIEIALFAEYRKGINPNWLWLKNIEIDFSINDVTEILSVLNEEY